MAARNAREEVERITSDAERTGRTLEQLGALAGLSVGPHRIESYDISNTGASDWWPACRLRGWKAAETGLPPFQIKTLDHPDDYAAMERF